MRKHKEHNAILPTWRDYLQPVCLQGRALSPLVGIQDKHSKVSLSPSDVYTKSHKPWTLVWTLSVLGRLASGDGKGGFAADVSFASPSFLWWESALSKNWDWSTR